MDAFKVFNVAVELKHGKNKLNVLNLRIVESIMAHMMRLGQALALLNPRPIKWSSIIPQINPTQQTTKDEELNELIVRFL